MQEEIPPLGQLFEQGFMRPIPIMPGQMVPGAQSLGGGGGTAVPAAPSARVLSPRDQMALDIVQAQQKPIMKSDISGVKLRQPLQQMAGMTDLRAGAPMQPETVIDPAALQGSILVGTQTDRTNAGLNLFGLGGQPFNQPVALHGGIDYMRTGDPGAIWATDPGGMTTLNKQIAGAQKQYGDLPVNLVPYIMGARSGDFSTQTTDTLRQMLQSTPLSQKAKATFDQAMRENDPSWPGIAAFTQGDPWSATASGANRREFARLMDTKVMADLGFPDVGLARFGISKPELLNQPSLSSGYGIASVNPDFANRVFTPVENQHPDYSAALRGSYLGRLDQPAPADVMFQSFIADRNARLAAQGKSTTPNISQLQYSMSTSPVVQLANQQWLDNYMKAQAMAQALRDRGGG